MIALSFNGHNRAERDVHALLAFLAAFFLTMALAACMAVGPDYVRVEPKAPKKWHSKMEGGMTPGQIDPHILAQWWVTLNDQELSSIVERAVEANLDLQEARARVREARALRALEKARLFPAIDAGGSVKRSRSSRNSGTGKTQSLYAAGFDAGWELDVFGGVRRSIEAAQASLEAIREDLHDVLISLVAEVALNYIDVRTYQARLTAVKANIKAQKDIYELNFSRYQAGLIDELAVQQSRYVLESTRSQIPALQGSMEKAKNRLAVLIGEMPGAIHKELTQTKPIPVPPVRVAIGIPAETLRHRPDIRRAERNLAAATARIGVAKAEIYPKFSLPGTIGLESVSSGDFLKWGSRTWSLGPGMTWNIFHAGALRQNITVQTARQEQTLIQYESAVLKAQEEVENALVAYATEQRRREFLKDAVAAAMRARDLAWDRYTAGLVGFNGVLDAERSLQSLQDELAQSEGTVTSNLVRLYKALGGGWSFLDQSESLEKGDEPSEGTR